jgi:OOP family OmpA-OmpF porin
VRRASIIAFSVLLATLGGCNRPGPDKPGQDASAQASDQADDGQGEGEGGASSAAGQPASGEPAPEPKKSIIRPEVDAGPTQAPVLLPVHLVVPWPAKGVHLDDAGRALIDGLLGDPTFQAGGPVTIWGHSDSHGTDSANLASSRQRALAARAYLIAKG